MNEERPPFLTGSRVYGTPNDDSDLDVVMRCNAYVAMAIEAVIGRSASDYDHASVSIKCGELNLHLCGTDAEYDRWKRGTRSAEVVKPIDRDTAIRLLRVNGVDRGAEHDVGPYPRVGPGKLPILQDDGTVTPYREWMGWAK